MKYDVIIIGAGAAGLMCALTAGARGRKVLVLDHAPVVGEKIRISGGGRCNFTNIHTSPKNFISANPHFCKSALSRFTPADFVKMVEAYGIRYHEKTLGQLFCDGRSQQIIDMLLDECQKHSVEIELSVEIRDIAHEEGCFVLSTNRGEVQADAVVMATGGLSIPKIGASDFGYRIARQFGHNVVGTAPALVPLTFGEDILAGTKALAGLAVEEIDVRAQDGTAFKEALLFTHRGLSGPAILQISSYWHASQDIRVNLAPGVDIFAQLKAARTQQPKKQLRTLLGEMLPQRLAEHFALHSGCDGRMADLSDDKLQHAGNLLNNWIIRPQGTEGYRTAEVTRGGVDTTELSGKTFESSKQKGLYFIGEVVDVTGHLGGYNFQWAWASGHACGEAV